MSLWFRRLILVQTFGGGFIAIAVLFMLVPQWKGPAWSYCVLLPFLAVALFGIWTGFLVVEDERRGLRWSRWYFATQILIFSSPYIAFDLCTGATLKLAWLGQNLSFWAKFGADLELDILQGRPWGIGVNLLGLFLFLRVKELREEEPISERSAAP